MRRTPVLMLLVVLLSVLWGTGAAVAGGPTSVLLSVPGEGRVAALYHTDTAYQALDELVSTGAGGSSGQQPGAGSGETVTLTWLIHDVQVWRVDHVHLGAPGAPWVETRQVTDGGSLWGARSTWHRADPGLRKLIDDLLDGKPAAPLAEPLGAEGAAAATVVSRPAKSTTVVEPRSARTIVAWTGAGVLAGLVAGVALTLATSRRRGQRPPVTSILAPLT